MMVIEPHVFLMAAESIDACRDSLSCVALCRAVGDYHAEDPETKDLVEAYTALFAPEPRADSGDRWLNDEHIPYEERRDWRVLALLFAHEMALTGDLHL